MNILGKNIEDLTGQCSVTLKYNKGWGRAGSRCSDGEPGHHCHVVGSPRGGEGGLVPEGAAIEHCH